MPEPRRPLKVFLCHASADKQKVRELYRTLRRRGIQPWLDAENLIPGQNWEEEIPKALHSSDAIIICLTPNSVDKEGYVQKEIKFALDKALEMPEGRIFLIPAKLENCDLPFRLRQYQAVNLYEKDGYVKLMKALKLRASQLERNTVELPRAEEIAPELKKVVEDRETDEPKQENPETNSLEPVVMVVGNNILDAGKDEITTSTKVEKRDVGTSKSEEQKPELEKIRFKRKPNTALIVALIGFAGTIIAGLLSSPLIAQWFSPVSTGMPTATITLTIQPTLASLTPVLNQTSTEITSLTPVPIVFEDPYPDPSDHIDTFGVRMRLVSAGEFIMGSEDGATDERPVHTVNLDAYYIDKYEVTNAFYKACVDDGVCQPPQNTSSFTLHDFYGKPEYDNYPVMFMSWNTAKTYCEWRNAQLPTEAQWEKAARGADERTYPWGEEINQTFAKYDQVGGPSAVGSYEIGKSPYGVYDMAGNVAEWVEDWYSQTFYTDSPLSNPSGPGNAVYRVYRGGTWYDAKEKVRTSERSFYKPDEILDGFGFRCAKSVP